MTEVLAGTRAPEVGRQRKEPESLWDLRRIQSIAAAAAVLQVRSDPESAVDLLLAFDRVGADVVQGGGDPLDGAWIRGDALCALANLIGAGLFPPEQVDRDPGPLGRWVLPCGSDSITARPGMRTVSTKLPERLDRALRALAKRRGASLSAVIREALELFTRERCGSFDSRASDLAGCLEGPTDLSRSRKHMEGYGR